MKLDRFEVEWHEEHQELVVWRDTGLSILKKPENQPASQRGAIRLALGAEIHGRAERRAAASKIELRQGKSPR